jgi:hypothetical protein
MKKILLVVVVLLAALAVCAYGIITPTTKYWMFLLAAAIMLVCYYKVDMEDSAASETLCVVGMTLVGMIATIFSAVFLAKTYSNYLDLAMNLGAVLVGADALYVSILCVSAGSSRIRAVLVACVFFAAGGYLAYLVTYEGASVWLQLLAYPMLLVGVKLCSFSPLDDVVGKLMGIQIVASLVYFGYGIYLNAGKLCGPSLCMGVLIFALSVFMYCTPDIDTDWDNAYKRKCKRAHNKIGKGIGATLLCIIMLAPPILSLLGGAKPMPTPKTCKLCDSTNLHDSKYCWECWVKVYGR